MQELIHILDIFWNGDPDLQVQKSVAPIIIGAAVSALGGIIGGISNANRARKARARQQDFQDQLADAEANRQEIIDPFANIQDLSSMISNPFANLQVATQAAEFQAEEADLSLASSLDTLRATGASAGGATALAQAALRSKRGVSATIQQQEAQNARLRAQGEAQMQRALMSEAARVQQARAAGDQFTFQQQEARDLQQLNRLQTMVDNSQAQAAAFRSASNEAIFGAIGTIGGGLMALGADGFEGGGNKNEKED